MVGTKSITWWSSDNKHSVVIFLNRIWSILTHRFLYNEAWDWGAGSTSETVDCCWRWVDSRWIMPVRSNRGVRILCVMLIACYAGVLREDWQGSHLKDLQDAGMNRVAGYGDVRFPNSVWNFVFTECTSCWETAYLIKYNLKTPG